MTGRGLGIVAGSLAIRRQGIYFAMITLALAQMMFFFALQAKFTGGEDGIQAVPRGRLFGMIDLADQTNMYITVVVIFLAGFLLIYRIIHSPFGEVLKAIRENEPRAISLGYKTDRYKLVAFVLSATLAGPCRLDQGDRAADRLADRRRLADVGRGGADGAGRRARHRVRPGGRAPSSSSPCRTISPQVGQWVTVIQGVIFVVCVLLFRRGVIGELAHYLRIKL